LRARAPDAARMSASEQTVAGLVANMQLFNSHLIQRRQTSTMNTESQTSSNTRSGRSMPNGTDESTSSAIVREYHKLLADLEDLVASASTLTAEELSKAKAALTTRIASARASAARIGNVVSERVQAGAHATDEYVHKQPWQSVGIAAGAGLLIGFLVGRRNS
jgi:ElaB/YqjD/DUF883 family membrane-anchored ribosome-binding protein